MSENAEVTKLYGGVPYALEKGRTMSLFLQIRKNYGKLLHALGLVAGISTFVMMLLVVGNAVFRFGFNSPIPGTLEITEALLTVLILLSLAMTQYEGGHIHVVLITKHFSPKVQRGVELVAMLFGFIFFCWCTYAAWGFAAKSLAMNEQEWGAVRFPLYPVKYVVFGGMLLLAIQFALDAIAVALGVSLRDEAETTGEVPL